MRILFLSFPCLYHQNPVFRNNPENFHPCDLHLNKYNSSKLHAMESSIQCNQVFGTTLIFVAVIVRRVSNDHSNWVIFQWLVLFPHV